MKKETSHTEQGRVKCNGERLRKDRESGEKERKKERERTKFISWSRTFSI